MVKLSVVIPACNQEAEIGKAIQQFWTPDNQQAIEVIVADAGSKDGTQSVAHLLADQVLLVTRPTEQWKAVAKNAGAAAASGDVLLFLEPSIRLLSSLDGLLGKLKKVFGNGRPVAGARILDGAVAVRRSAFEKCGGYNEALSENEDEQLLGRLRKQGPIDSLEPLSFERVELPKLELEEVLA